MKNLKLVFKTSMFIAIIGWILLIAFPTTSFTDQIIRYIVIVLLCIIYVYLLLFQKNVTTEKYPKGSFWTLEGVVNIFKNPVVVLTGWVHYLAFDLMAGMYVKNDALLHGIHPGLVIPCLLLTMLYGPCGLLLYFIVRWFYM